MPPPPPELTTRVEDALLCAAQVHGRPGPARLDAANAAAAALDEATARLQDALRRGSERPGEVPLDELRALFGLLEECGQAREQLRELVTGLRLGLLEDVRTALAGLRAREDETALLPAAVSALGQAGGFAHTLLASVHPGGWRAQALWAEDGHDRATARAVREHLTGRDVPLRGGVLETELVRRKVPVLVREPEGSGLAELLEVAGSRSVVAAPVVVGRTVVGFLAADAGPGRELSTLDRDAVAAFASGFGLVLERTTLLDRLHRQRERTLAGLQQVAQQLDGVESAGPMLVRGDKKSVAVFRTAAGLRRAPVNPVDRLLTSRERQVVDLVVDGASNRRIADELVVTEETVKSHLRSVFRKLRASSRADAVSRYLHLRLQEG